MLLLLLDDGLRRLPSGWILRVDRKGLQLVPTSMGRMRWVSVRLLLLMRLDRK